MPKTLSDQDIADFRAELCRVATERFARYGYDGVTMRQLAEALGCSPKTPYRYFKDKDAMMAAVRARGFLRHAMALEAAYQEAAERGAGRNQAVSEAYIRFAVENPQAYKLMFDFQQPTMADYPELVEAAARSKATMTAHLKSQPQTGSGAERAADRELVGHVFWAGLHGAIMLHLTGMLAAPNDLGAVVSRMHEIMAAGLSRPKA